LQDIYVQANLEEDSNEEEDNDTDDGWEYESEEEEDQPEKKGFVNKFKQSLGG
jgi:hypothetical protein